MNIAQRYVLNIWVAITRRFDFQFYTKIRKAIPGMAFLERNYIGGVFVVSGGVVLLVSVFVVSTTGGLVTVLVSTVLLSDDPETFLVELHAVAANSNIPANARINPFFFIT
jgi:hypothetical protein